MKTIFKIPPSIDADASVHLLIETGLEEISFLFFTKEPFRVEGLLSWQFDDHRSSPGTAAEINSIVQSEPSLQQSFSSVNTLYNVKEAVLVPKRYYDPQVKKDMLALVFGSDQPAVIFDENIKAKEIVNLYRVDKPVVDNLRELFPFSVNYHTNTLLLTRLPVAGNSLTCVVYQHSIKIVLQKENELQVALQIGYNTAADVIYHLLNACTQYHIPADTVQLILSGSIEEQSSLYAELYKYFLNIAFQALPEGTEIADGMKQHPEHFFSHLILLAACV